MLTIDPFYLKNGMHPDIFRAKSNNIFFVALKNNKE